MEKSTSGRHGSAVSDDSAVADDANGITSPTTVTYQESWQPRRKETMLNGFVPNSLRRSRQKSLSEAFRSIKQRRGSVTENAHEVVEALKAPVSPKLIVRPSLPSPESTHANHVVNSFFVASGT